MKLILSINEPSALLPSRSSADESTFGRGERQVLDGVDLRFAAEADANDAGESDVGGLCDGLVRHCSAEARVCEGLTADLVSAIAIGLLLHPFDPTVVEFDFDGGDDNGSRRSEDASIGESDEFFLFDPWFAGDKVFVAVGFFEECDEEICDNGWLSH